MAGIRLIAWDPREAAEKARLLRGSGFVVEDALPDPAVLFEELAEKTPSAVIIDLDRLPSRGRDLAVAIRFRKSTRGIPLLFTGGEAAKVDRIRELLPDAEYCGWTAVGEGLKRVMESPPNDPVVPASMMAAYGSVPLLKKLGITEGRIVRLIEAPADFEKVLGELPRKATVRRGPGGAADITIWFVRSIGELRDGVERFAAFSERGGLWIVWPKRGSGIDSDVSQADVRRIGMAAGMVDFKICSLDASWSGLRFSRRAASK